MYGKDLEYTAQYLVPKLFAQNFSFPVRYLKCKRLKDSQEKRVLHYKKSQKRNNSEF